MPVDTGFRTIEHTADVGIAAWGADLKQAFAASGRGLLSLIVDLRTVRERLEREIEITAADRESLLVEWLNELIYLFDTELLLLRRFEITRLTNRQLTARAYGEPVNTTRHHLKTGIKAATYHRLRVVETTDGGRVQVIFDI